MRREKPWNEARLLELIAQKIGESDSLEFKGAEAFERRTAKSEEDKATKITKTVSAFANAGGGIVIYGMRQVDRVAAAIEPINAREFSPEWIDQIVNQIEPRIAGISTKVVQLSTGKDHVAYVLIIPKGETAHQARDRRYYRRYNFQAEPMRDHEVRDVMGRRQTPKIAATFRIFLGYLEPTPRLRCTCKNQGGVLARDAICVLEFPPVIDRHFVWPPNDDDRWIIGDDGVNYFFEVALVLTKKAVLFPGFEANVDLLFNLLRDAPKTTDGAPPLIANPRPFRWKIFADNAPVSTGSVDAERIIRRRLHPEKD